MSEATPRAEQRCIFCGSAYREPRWGRAYNCGACGQPLQEAPQRSTRSWRLPTWVYYATGAVLLTALLVWLATTRRAQHRGFRQDMQVNFGMLQQLPAHQEERIRQRLALLEADHQKDPQDPVVLTLLAENYLQLGVLHQNADGKQAAAELQRSQRLAEELQTVAPELSHVSTFLMLQSRSPLTLGWIINGSSSNTTRLAVIQDDAATSLMGEAPSRLTVPDFASKMGFSGDRERRDSRSDPDIMVPGSSFPTVGRPQGNVPGAYAVPAPPINGPRGFFGNGPSGSAGPAGTPVGQTVEELRAQVAANPADPRAIQALGERLEAQAQLVLAVYGVREPGRTMFARNLAGALKAYSAGAGRVRTRLRRAEMLFSAAGVCRKLGDTDEEIRLLQSAAQETPYAPMIWRQLQNALLNKGDYGKARDAWKQYQDWSLPRTRDRRS